MLIELIISAVVVVVFAIGAIIIYVSSKNKKGNQVSMRQREFPVNEHPVPGNMKSIPKQPVYYNDFNSDEDATVQMRQEEDDDDEATVLLSKEEDSTCVVNKVILQGNNPTDKLEFLCTSEVTIGRKSRCDVQIQGDQSVSGVHCTVLADNQGNLWIKDNDSSNGTYLNGEKLTEEAMLVSGDTLVIGRSSYAVEIEGVTVPVSRNYGYDEMNSGCPETEDVFAWMERNR